MMQVAPPENASAAPVSVVVCNYNGVSYLPACLDAIARLAEVDGRIDECIVVDNASTDASLTLLAERQKTDERLSVLEMPSNDGPASARNAGMRAARNRWVLALDNDATPRPDMLAKLRAALAAHPGTPVLQPRSVFRHEPDRVHYDGGSLHCAGLIALRNFYTPLAQAEGEGVVAVDVAVSVCLLVDRDRILALGGYEPSYFILFEDLDLSYRLRMAGDRILSVEDAIVEHDAGTPGVSFRKGTDYPSRRVFYHSRNRWLFLLRCYSARTLLLLSPALLLYELVWLGFAVSQGGLGSYVRGKAEVFRRRHELRSARAEIQARRLRADGGLLVGGPLTLTPSLRQGLLKRLVQGTLDLFVRAWWAVVRPLCT